MKPCALRRVSFYSCSFLACTRYSRFRFLPHHRTVSLFWDDGTEDTAVLIPNEHPGDVGEDVSTLSLNGTDLLFNNRW